MGILFRSGVYRPPLDLVPAIQAALLAQPASSPDIAKHEAEKIVHELSPTNPRFDLRRFLVAITFVLVFALFGMFCEAQGWTTSSSAFFSFANTLFGGVVGLIAGEAAHTGINQR